MTDRSDEVDNCNLELEYELDAPPEKVWRAISLAEFRENWLPRDALSEPVATRIMPGEEISYRMRESVPPFLESTVTFKIGPNVAGGTKLRIIHKLDGFRREAVQKSAANSNSASRMRAA